MLSLFPQILFLAPIGTALLRIAAGVAFLAMGYAHGMRSRELSAVKFPVVGRGAWIVWTAVVIETVVGAALVVGAYTQLAAIFASLGALKILIWHKRYSQFFFWNRTSAALLLVICLSLIVSGAGLFAFDLPL